MYFEVRDTLACLLGDNPSKGKSLEGEATSAASETEDTRARFGCGSSRSSCSPQVESFFRYWNALSVAFAELCGLPKKVAIDCCFCGVAVIGQLL